MQAVAINTRPPTPAMSARKRFVIPIPDLSRVYARDRPCRRRSLLHPWVEGVPQAIRDEDDAEHRQEDHHAWRIDQPGCPAKHVLRAAQHVAPARLRHL